MLVKAEDKAKSDGEEKSSGPPMQSWSAEVEALAAISDRLERLIYVTRAVGGDKTAKPPKALPRPQSALPRIRARLRQAKHEGLAAKLLRR